MDTSEKTLRLVEIKGTREPHIKIALHVAFSSIRYFSLNKEKKRIEKKGSGLSVMIYLLSLSNDAFSVGTAALN